MTREEVLEKTRKIIYDCYPDMAEQAFDENTVVNTDTGIDSMGFILIICKLEALFGIKIPERQWKKMQTLGEVVDGVYSRLPKA